MKGEEKKVGGWGRERGKEVKGRTRGGKEGIPGRHSQ